MYRNIIFDLGGVVVEWNPRDFLMDYFLNKHTEEIVFDLTFGSETWQKLDLGVITREEGNQLMLQEASRYGRTFEVQTVIDEWTNMLRTNRATVKTMCRLKLAGYRLYYLSNIASDTLDLIKQRDFYPIFDGGLPSYEIGVNKPDTRIYRTIMQRYELAYDETIFVDDSKLNTQTAYNLGMTGILYKSPKSLLRALETCGIHLPKKSSARPAHKPVAQTTG